jgi:hypothetical protein
MKKVLSLVILAVLATLLLTGCSLVGSGPIVDKSYDISDFREIEISHDFKYDITQSGTYSVNASIHENLVDHLDIYKSGQVLQVKLKPGNIANSDARIKITLPQLERLQVSGAAKGNVNGFKSSQNLDLELSGASQCEINIEAGRTRIDISGASRANGKIKTAETRITVTGASNCEFNGTAGDTRLELSGASHANLRDFIIENAGADISGASGADINTSGTLDLSLSGASTLNYYGNPKLGKIDISGASQMHEKK